MILELQGKAPASRALIMETLSERYGWTPDEIRSMRTADVAAYIRIINAKTALKKANAKR